MASDRLTPTTSRAGAAAPATALPSGAAARAAAVGAANAAQAGGQLATLVTTAKSVRQTVAPDTPAQERRTTRFKHQRAAAKLFPGSRTANCLWAVSSLTYGVDVIHNPVERRARFNGLQTCGSVWVCPCCSATVSQLRCREANALLSWGRKQGYRPVMVSLTFRHAHGDDLAQQLDALKASKQRWARHRAFADYRASLVGSVTATEVTGGGQHGWHPHFHQIMIVKADTEKEAIAKTEALRDAWMASLRAEGLDGNEAAFHVQGAAQAGQYIAKWGAAEELVLSGKKSGRSGRAPFELLAAFADGDAKAGALFAEYGRVFKGRRQLVWSPGLKKLAGIDEVTDEQAAEEAVRLADAAKEDAVLRNFTPGEWKKIRPQRGAVLKFAELAGAAGVDAVERANALPYPTDAGMGGSPCKRAKRTKPGPSHVTDVRRVASATWQVSSRYLAPSSDGVSGAAARGQGVTPCRRSRSEHESVLNITQTPFFLLL